MSQRPILQKQLGRLRKKMRPALPVYFDLVDWLKLRRYAQTTGEAHRIILAGRVRNGSHTIGLVQAAVHRADGTLDTEDVVQRVQPAKYKDGLIVVGDGSS